MSGFQAEQGAFLQGSSEDPADHLAHIHREDEVMLLESCSLYVPNDGDGVLLMSGEFLLTFLRYGSCMRFERASLQRTMSDEVVAVVSSFAPLRKRSVGEMRRNKHLEVVPAGTTTGEA